MSSRSLSSCSTCDYGSFKSERSLSVESNTSATYLSSLVSSEEGSPMNDPSMYIFGPHNPTTSRVSSVLLNQETLHWFESILEGDRNHVDAQERFVVDQLKQIVSDQKNSALEWRLRRNQEEKRERWKARKLQRDRHYQKIKQRQIELNAKQTQSRWDYDARLRYATAQEFISASEMSEKARLKLQRLEALRKARSLQAEEWKKEWEEWGKDERKSQQFLFEQYPAYFAVMAEAYGVECTHRVKQSKEHNVKKVENLLKIGKDPSLRDKRHRRKRAKLPKAKKRVDRIQSEWAKKRQCLSIINSGCMEDSASQEDDFIETVSKSPTERPKKKTPRLNYKIAEIEIDCGEQGVKPSNITTQLRRGTLPKPGRVEKATTDVHHTIFDIDEIVCRFGDSCSKFPLRPIQRRNGFEPRCKSADQPHFDPTNPSVNFPTRRYLPNLERYRMVGEQETNQEKIDEVSSMKSLDSSETVYYKSKAAGLPPALRMYKNRLPKVPNSTQLSSPRVPSKRLGFVSQPRNKSPLVHTSTNGTILMNRTRGGAGALILRKPKSDESVSKQITRHYESQEKPQMATEQIEIFKLCKVLRHAPKQSFERQAPVGWASLVNDPLKEQYETSRPVPLDEPLFDLRPFKQSIPVETSSSLLSYYTLLEFYQPSQIHRDPTPKQLYNLRAVAIQSVPINEMIAQNRYVNEILPKRKSTLNSLFWRNEQKSKQQREKSILKSMEISVKFRKHGPSMSPSPRQTLPVSSWASSSACPFDDYEALTKSNETEGITSIDRLLRSEPSLRYRSTQLLGITE